ncbi:MAG: hypothetical protein GX811_07705, partial [Lentisphaerae bacterium]|nr:hypothetical protein [Lentisphaerota bacterium]
MTRKLMLASILFSILFAWFNPILAGDSTIESDSTITLLESTSEPAISDLGSVPDGVTPEIWSKLAPQVYVAVYQFKTDSDGVFAAINPEQGFEIRADGIGVTVRNGIALRATQLGVSAKDMKDLPVAQPQAQGTRLEYRRGRVLEWFENRSDGLEQGFTIDAPNGVTEQESLQLLVGLEGARSLKVDASGKSAVVSDMQGRNFGYSGLKAWDATGRTLDCRMEASLQKEARIMLVCDTHNAVWPITIDPLLTVIDKKLTVTTTQAELGVSVAVDGDVAVVGATSQDSYKGAAYIFERNHGGLNNWGQVAELVASDAEEFDCFGHSVSVEGDVAVIGASSKHNRQGAAYIFERNM